MKSKQMIGKFIVALLTVTGILFFLGLVYSVISSGYSYQFDVDEFFYAQQIYLYAKGFRPYLDVYTSVYPPLFSWLMTPVFSLRGFTFDAIYTSRIIMMIFLGLRLFVSWHLIKLIFNKRTAWIFLPLFLFDPFAVFTTMQLRPDNFMLLMFTTGLLFFSRGLTQNNKKNIIISGILFGCSLLILPKVVPSLAVLGLIYLIYSFWRGRYSDFFSFVISGTIPILLFCLYLFSEGSLGEMIKQMIIDSRLQYTNFAYPIPINSLMRPDNVYIFGTMGKPVTWVYLWLIAPLGAVGVYHAIHSVLASSDNTPKNILKIILAGACIAQWAVLFALQVAFMQHYMPFHYFAVIFIAYAIDELLLVTKRYRFLGSATSLIFAGLYIYLAASSIRFNLVRATITGMETQAQYNTRWQQIPENQAVFPGYLFRPPSYPLPYGGFIVNLPAAIISRLPNIANLIDTKRPLLLLDDYTLFRLPADAQLYISEHYTRAMGDAELMVRKP